jgi:subtilase family serine protease
MKLHDRFVYQMLSVVLLTVAGLIPLPQALALNTQSVPASVSRSQDLGRVNSTTEFNLTVVLKLHNEDEFDQKVADLYNPSSSQYHQWLNASDFARYAPTNAELKAVKNELESHGLSVVSEDSDGFWIRVHGTAAQVENAFQTQLHNYQYNNRKFTANKTSATLTGAAAEFVKTVSGIERHTAHTHLKVAQDIKAQKPLYKKAYESVSSSFLSSITGTPLTASENFLYTTSGASLPTADYSGTVYDADSSLTVSYTPAQLQKHYGLSSLISQGYNGSGQTIALVEAYGYSAAKDDANVAAALFGLPKLTSSSFSVVYPDGAPLSSKAADLSGWTGEIALDIQSAHAIAPGAKIVVVAAAGQDNEDLIDALSYIIKNKVAYTVSSSWEIDDEILSGSAEEQAFNSVLKKGAASGISFQFSTGDSGDLGLGTPVGAVAVPSNSPYATAVGGTSILNNPYGSGDIVAGWGNNATYINDYGPLDPPVAYGFLGGAGGGQSQYYAKPSWQKSLSGKYRQLPDVSALADPYTGFPIIVTESGTRYAEAGVGGTSLASPIFTAIWAIADQYNGSPLGQAAPAVAKLKTGSITVCV